MPHDLTIDLDDETSNLIRDAVESGRYASPSDVVAAAVRVLRGQVLNGEPLHGHGDELLGHSMDELRRLGDEGETSGPGTMTVEEIQREGFRRARMPFPGA